MRVLAGLDLGGATATEQDWPLGRGAIGNVCWGPIELLRDLELRLGLSTPDQPKAVRVARFAARMAKLTPQPRFFSRSFEIDPLGSAESILRLRDLLVESGWKGESIADGGARLEALYDLERLSQPELPRGDADRVAAVITELTRRSVRLYTELTLVEPSETWSACWQLVFRALERAGTRLLRQESMLPAAPPNTDLGRLQRALHDGPRSQGIELQGDGSFIVIEAETSWQAAQAVAAILARLPADQTVVVRERDASALDNALAAAGVHTQGLRSVSPWRSALQVLPLALELAFEPKDPYRLLELLTLPTGPFNGFIGHALARALSQAPGIGSPAWEAVKQQLTSREQASTRGAEQLAWIAEWLEAPAVDSRIGAPITTLTAVVERVRRWLVSRIQSSPDDPLLLVAAQQAATLRAALESEPRPSLTLVQVRKLAESVLENGTTADLLCERAGRSALVNTPSHLRSVCGSVVWWSFTASPSVSDRLPWRRRESAALAAAHLRFPDPGQRLTAGAAAARFAFCCATERLVLVVPREHAGQSLSLAPLWDELLAGAKLDERALAAVTVSDLELRTPDATRLLRERPLLTPHEPMDLPGGHLEWIVPSQQVAPLEHFSPASLEALLGCPLEWVLRYRARSRAGGHSLPPLYLLTGSLGHRLVELLHGARAFELEESALRLQAEASLDALFQREGAVLLRPGMGFERAQLKQQLIRAAIELLRLLREAGLHLVAVEKSIEASWQDGKLEGRLDLLVATEDGLHAIIDMKNGMTTYRDQLRAGRALQLAAYAFVHATEQNDEAWPDAGYFSLKQAKLFGLPSRILPQAEVIPGPSLRDTWQRVERSVRRVLPLVQRGVFAVTGVRGARPLLEASGMPDTEAAAHFVLPNGERCQYCRYDTLCGRRWETLQ
jgi:ATP-dependent helicase/nuclease subunit B